jgi:AcrR family transcriptional regulator
MSGTTHEQRAERILDAAAELVLRWGYKRVTIDEVAKLAGIGKGTVYLHFRTREALFIAVLLRDSLDLAGEFVEAIREDPAEMLPHRQVRRAYLGVMRRPLLRAMFSRDAEVLGVLAHEAKVAPLRTAKFGLTGDFHGLLREYGIMRTDLDLEAQQYAMTAVQSGFYLVDPLTLGLSDLDLTAKAETLSRIIRHAVELPGTPDADVLRALAPKAIAIFEQLRTVMAAGIHGDPAKGE